MIGLSSLPLYLAPESPPPNDERAGLPEPLRSVATGTHVLVIEDEAMIAWMLESLLEDMGFSSIALAASGEEAIEKARLVMPGLIISDVNLGAGVDGVAAAVAILRGRSIPVIFVTGYGINDARDRVGRSTLDAPVLRKPVQVAELRIAVVAALNKFASH